MTRDELARQILRMLQEGALSKTAAYSLLKSCSELTAAPAAAQGPQDRAIAIIGLAARMPQADSAGKFWKLSLEARDCIRELPASRRKDVEALYQGLGDDDFLPGERYWRAAYMDEVDMFDAEYFGITGAEARLMDPAHRLFLEAATEALQEGGYETRIAHTQTGVFTGNPGFFYADAAKETPGLPVVTGNIPEFMGSRVAFLYDLKGPCFSVQSTCSASLVAVFQACQALRAGQCELAIAGGATVFSFPANVRTNPTTAAGIVSGDERCRPFAEGANGIGRGEGVVVFLLKPLARAIADGDAIQAVIRGGAVNNDGRCAGLTAPNPIAQTQVLKAAWRDAEIDPGTLGYIETHGTGTHLGDPIEISAISRALEEFTPRKQFCGVSSLKGSVGHLLDGAAGVSGLLRAVLAVREGVIPPTMHFEEPNQQIDFINSPVFVADRPTTWPATQGPRLAGISSFGFNGTNVHLVIEEAPRVEAPKPVEGAESLFLVSARTPEALRGLMSRYRDWLATEETRHGAAEVAYSLAVGRQHHPVRRAFVARSLQEWREQLSRVLGAEGEVPKDTVGIFGPGSSSSARSGLETKAQAYVRGEAVEVAAWFPEKQRVVKLPSYPFQRVRHWVELKRAPQKRLGESKRARAAESAPRSRLMSEAELLSFVTGTVQEVLELSEPPALSAGFFELGGNSLLATMVIARIQNELGVALELRTLFEAETVQALAQVLAKRRGTADTSLVPGGQRGESVPLSFSQERLWVIRALDEGAAGSYLLVGGVRMTGPIEPQRLEEALAEVTARHEALRTGFTPDEASAKQLIASELSIPVEKVDLRDAGAERERLLERYIRESASRPFDLRRPPLLRCAWVRLTEEESLLVLAADHMICDGWSLGLVVRQWMEAYVARLTGAPRPHREPPMQLADYCIWQRSRMQGELLERQLSYWRRKLQGTPPLQLPADFERPVTPSHRGGLVHFALPPEPFERLRAFSRAEGVTLYVACLAAFKVLLSRLSGQTDFAIGTPSANRGQLELEGVVGFLANTLALRADLSGQPSFREVLRRVRQSVLDADEHKEVPFERIVSELRLPRDVARHPVFQVNFTLEQPILREMALPAAGLHLRPFDLHNDTAKFDVTLTLVEEGGRLGGQLEFARDLFTAGTAERWARCFVRLLESAIEDPARPVQQLSLLSQEERQEVLRLAHPAPEPRDVEDLSLAFTRQARLTPQAIAASTGSQALSFSELEGRVQRMALHLQELGVEKESRVGVLLSPGTDLLATLLAVLRAGGAYVPLDPAAPPERLRLILEDAGARWLVTDGAHAFSLGVGFRGQVLECGRDFPKPSGRASLPERYAPESLAYILYTSGSTGRPKGVMVTRDGLAHYIEWARRHYRPEEGEGAPVHSSIAFDLTITSLLVPLVSGKPVHFVSHEDKLEGLRSALTERGGWSLVKLTPSHLRVLQLSPEEMRRSARALVVGGEALHYADVEAWRLHAPHVRIINEYGPTETVVGCCVFEVSPSGPRRGAVPIGRPIAETELYVLDEKLELLPVGVPGELYIGGRGVARGYWNAPKLTEERFLPNPFSQVPGARFYRTGDLARWRSDGQLEFLGRVDHQVKVRGYRVEPGEVEAAIASLPGVGEVVVIPREDPQGTRLFAYVVPSTREGGAPPPESWTRQLRQDLSRRLPEYMVPVAWFVMPELPLTINGKVDRARLPERVHGTEPGRLLTPPRNDAERTLLRIWQGLLRIDEMGIEDNFFDLGGDSILCMQASARARREGISVRPGDFLRFQTVAALSDALSRLEAGLVEEERPRGAVPLIPIQRWWAELELANPHHFNQAVLLQVMEPVLPHLEAALNAVLAFHDAFRLRFRKERDGWVQELSERALHVPLQRHELAGLSEAEQRQFIEETCAAQQASLDIGTGQVARAVLFELGARELPRLFIVIHHMVVDGVSWRTLLEDLHTALRQLRAGAAIQLQARTSSFKRWAERLVDLAQSPAIVRELEDWERHLGRPSTQLPVDFREGPNLESSAEVFFVSLTAAQTRTLLQRRDPGFNESVLAALAHALRDWVSGTRFLVDFDGHGREPLFPEIDLSRTVGWMTSLTPVSLEVGASLAATAGNIRESLQAMPHGRMGHGLLRYLNHSPEVRRRMAALPRADISYNNLGQLDQALEGTCFRPSDEYEGSWRGGVNPRPHLIALDAHVLRGQFRVRWEFSNHLHRRGTIAAVAESFLENLRALIDGA